MRNSIIFCLVIVPLVLMMSCNKTPMKGEYSPFVGTWKWFRTSWAPNGGSEILVMEADNQSYLYTIEITKKGEMFWRKDGEELQKFDLKVQEPESGCHEGAGCSCSIIMKHPTLFTGFGYNCSLGYEQLVFYDSGFPYDAPDEPENNWFIRME